MKTAICLLLLATLTMAYPELAVSYGNYFDNNPFNDYPVLMN